MNQLKIRGYATALFSTWYFVESLGILFDCGDGVTSALLQKARKVKHCFISHADRDHLGGLLQFLQLNGRPDLNIYYPKDCGSFPALAEFSSKFDPPSAGTKWHPLADGDEVKIQPSLAVHAKENLHVRSDENQVKSLSYGLVQSRRKLHDDLRKIPVADIAAIRSAHGEDAITHEVRSKPLFYSGDTPVLRDGRYRDVSVLIHEATFLKREELLPHAPKRNLHSSLDDVLEMVAESNVQHLILGHFSSRYSQEQIDQAIELESKRLKLDVRIDRILPGETISIYG